MPTAPLRGAKPDSSPRGILKGKDSDYDETFSQVVRSESVRSVIALASKNGLQLHQMDITTAFLNGDLEEECTCNSQKALSRMARNIWSVDSRKAFMVSNSRSDVGTERLMPNSS